MAFSGAPRPKRARPRTRHVECCVLLAGALNTPCAGPTSDAKADANVTATPKMIKKTIQVTRKKTYHVRCIAPGFLCVSMAISGHNCG